IAQLHPPREDEPDEERVDRETFDDPDRQAPFRRDRHERGPDEPEHAQADREPTEFDASDPTRFRPCGHGDPDGEQADVLHHGAAEAEHRVHGGIDIGRDHARSGQEHPAGGEQEGPAPAEGRRGDPVVPDEGDHRKHRTGEDEDAVDQRVSRRTHLERGFGVSPLSASGHPEVADRLPHERIVAFGGQGRGDLDEQADHGCEHGEKCPDPLGLGRNANGARTGHHGPSLRQPRLTFMVSTPESETFWCTPPSSGVSPPRGGTVLPMVDYTVLAERAFTLLQGHHQDEPLVLPTVWDAWSARAMVDVGFNALSIGSHPLADSLGHADGEAMTLEQALEGISRITSAVNVPVTADLESGYDTPAPELIAGLLEAGAVGVNIEDTIHSRGSMRSPEEHAEYIWSLRRAADAQRVHVVINARTDVFKHPGDFDDPTAEAGRRLRLCTEAGAASVYPVRLPDVDTLKSILSRVTLPLNVTAHPIKGAVPEELDLAQLADLGVGRVTFGPLLQAALTD